jgi:nucleoside 2-deoxyribosyltransferase
MYIYVVCPVRNVTKEQTQEIDDYVFMLEREGHRVHYPPRDVNQDDETGINIVKAHMKAMKAVDRVDIFWDKTSSGSHFDLGMAMIVDKPLKLVKTYQEDNAGKSYVKVMKIMERGNVFVECN